MTVPPLDPKLWSQERDFPRDAAATGGGAPIASSPSTFERIIRYAERDDLLLYATALFGILMYVSYLESISCSKHCFEAWTHVSSLPRHPLSISCIRQGWC